MVAPPGTALAWQLPRTGASTVGLGSYSQGSCVPARLSTHGAVAVHSSLEVAGKLVDGHADNAITGVGACLGRLRRQDTVAVRVERRHKGDGHAGERAVGDEWRRRRLPGVRGEEGAHAIPVRAGRGVLRAMPAGEIVAEGQLGMSRVPVADDRGAARDDQLARAQGAEDRGSVQGRTRMAASDMWWPQVTLRPGVMKSAPWPGRAMQAGAPGRWPEYASMRDTARCAGLPDCGMGWWSSWPSAANNMPSHPYILSRPQSVLRSQSTRGFFWPRTARLGLRVPGGRAACHGDGGLDRVHVLADDGQVEIAPPPRHRPRRVRIPVDLGQVVAGRAANGVAQPLDASTSQPADLPWKKWTRRSHVLDSTKTSPNTFLLGHSSKLRVKSIYQHSPTFILAESAWLFLSLRIMFLPQAMAERRTDSSRGS